MPWTINDLAAVDAALASGTQEVHFADRSIRSFSAAELLVIRREILRDVALQSDPTPTIRWTRFGTGSGT